VLPGKKFTPEDIARILWRRKWLVLVPFVTIAVLTVLIASFLPERYRCDTLILVVPQRVPDAYVRSNITVSNERTTTLQDRIETSKQQILSRTRLERIVTELNLYPKERRVGLIEDIVQRMRNDIQVQPVSRGDAFTVSFTYVDRRLALEVVNRLAAAFIDESNQDRTLFAESTTSFLETQLEDARRNLQQIEAKVADYRTRHSGELPTERDSNLQVLANTQSQLQQLGESINRDRDRRYLLERTLTEMAAETAAAPPPQVVVNPANPGDATAVAGRTAAERLQSARSQLSVALLRYKNDHPDVVRLTRDIAELEAKAQQEALQRPLSPEASLAQPATPADEQRQVRMRDLRLEIEGLDRLIGGKQQDEKTLRAKIAEYQRRVEATPARETELTGLLRDYSTVQQHYGSLLSRQEDSKIAAALERRQIGEQLRMVDQPRLPERPVSPNRPMIDLAGAAAGLAIGLGFVALLEYRDNSFRNDEEVVRILAIPVVAMIPLMLSRVERAAERRRAMLIAGATAVVFLGAVAVALWWFWWRLL
jgi:polysaccharide chain length determinant protein (PEP-CTERM system associated)